MYRVEDFRCGMKSSRKKKKEIAFLVFHSNVSKLLRGNGARISDKYMATFLKFDQLTLFTRYLEFVIQKYFGIGIFR